MSCAMKQILLLSYYSLASGIGPSVGGAIGGLIVTSLLLVLITRKNKKKMFYISLSVIMSLIYLLVWYFQFK